MDPDVVEIPPPVPRPPRMLKHKEVMVHDVIELDEEENNVDLMLFGEVDEKNVKGKAINFGSLNEVEVSKTFDPIAHNIINLDGQSSDASCDDDNDDTDLFSEDFMDVDEYALLQAHFDNADIPPGVEAPIPFLLDPLKSKKKPITGIGSSSVQKPFPVQSGGSTNFPIQMDSTRHPMEVDLSEPRLVSQSFQSKKKATASQHRGFAPNLPLGVASKSRWRRPFQYRKKQHNLSSSTNYDSVNQSGTMKLPSGIEPSFWEPHIPDSIKKQVGMNTFHSSSYVDISKLPHGVGPSLPWSQAPFKANFKSPFFYHTAHPSFNPPIGSAYHPQDPADIHPWFEKFHHNLKNDAVIGSSENDDAVGSSTDSVEAKPILDKDEILRKFQLFKQFDTVEDHSDHHYTSNGSSLKHSSKNWAKRIQEEWKILEKDLPDTIFVRVYESRMDLLRAVIVGAEGTPYHDGLFFFDVFFPSSYPNVPPHVYYHSGGLRLNPNLYNCGKVCLSLLNTWSGDKNEKWIPGTSTMLQVLVSIQGLILNTKPYFNEPGFASMSGSVAGEKQSLQYNETAFLLSLQTMMYSIKRPPKHFEDFVMGHFCNCAHDILIACKAYMDGAQVGCLVKGGVQDVDEGDKSCSKQFKDSLAQNVKRLVKEFSKIGVEDCQKFLSSTVNVNKKGHKSQVAP